MFGVVQVIPAWPPNQPHRADIAKLLVHRRARGRGAAEALMAAAEDAAREMNRTVLVLDTVTGGAAERLYEKRGWTRVGVIPDFALMPDGALLRDDGLLQGAGVSAGLTLQDAGLGPGAARTTPRPFCARRAADPRSEVACAHLPGRVATPEDYPHEHRLGALHRGDGASSPRRSPASSAWPAACVLMGALALVLPVSAAFVTHGVLQLVANGWRAILHRKHVRWDIVGWYALASLIAGVVVSFLALHAVQAAAVPAPGPGARADLAAAAVDQPRRGQAAAGLPLAASRSPA